MKNEEYKEPTNQDKAARVDVVLDAYVAVVDGFRDEADVRDLLTDIMHYCDREGINFDQELSRATDNYAEEK